MNAKMEEVHVQFKDITTGVAISELPSRYSSNNLQLGKQIQIHLFKGGWRVYKIKRIDEGDPTEVYVKRLWL
jgi:hypothetical protein